MKKIVLNIEKFDELTLTSALDREVVRRTNLPDDGSAYNKRVIDSLNNIWKQIERQL